NYCGGAIEIEASASWPADPAAFGDQPILNKLRLSWSPGHLLDGLVLIEPVACFDFLFIAGNLLRRDSGIDAGGRPDVPARREYVIVHRHIGVEVFDGYGHLDGFLLLAGKFLQYIHAAISG